MNNMSDTTEYDLWWALSSEKAGLRSMQIVKSAGGSERLFEMDREELKRVCKINEKTADYIIYRRNTWDPKKAFLKLEEQNVRFIPWHDTGYPKRLLQIANHPFALFVKGNLPEEDKPAVAVIGARECSEYGRECAIYFGKALAITGVDVISGMAIGIDGIAQQAALEAGGKSYAVLGCGPDICYPFANRKLHERLCTHGGVLSEYGPSVPAVNWHFPVRNRIIAGLADVVLVVEAKAKSGTLITADMALDAGREVMIVPGRITDAMSVGCIGLWESGARPATCVEDVLKVLSDQGYSFTQTDKNCENMMDRQNKIPLESKEKLVYSGFDLYARSAEEVMKQTKLPYQEFVRILTKLELSGLLKETGRGFYVCTAGLQEEENV